MKVITNDEKRLYKKAVKYLYPFKYRIVIIYLSTIISNLLGLLPILYMGKIIDCIVTSDLNGVKSIILKLILIYLVSTFFSIMETFFANQTINRMAKSIKDSLYEKIIYYKFSEYNIINHGKLLTTLENDSIVVSQFFINEILNTAIALLTLIVSIVFIFSMSFELSMIAIISFPITFIGNIIFGSKSKQYSNQSKSIKDRYYNFFKDTIDNIKQIKCLNIEREFRLKNNSITKHDSDVSIILSVVNMFSGLFSSIVTSVSEWLTMFVAAILIINSDLTIGTYVAFNGYLIKFMESMKSLLSVNITIQTTSVSLKRIDDILCIDTEELGKGINLENSNGDIVFKNVYFKYKSNNEYVIKNLSARFKKNTVSVLVGENGAGKTTILDLLAKLYKVNNGSIYIGDKNIDSLSKESVRNNISYIQQNPVIFNDTIFNNFRFVKNNITKEEVLRIISLVGLSKMIKTLPRGLNTLIGNNGHAFSGGEKQRIAIGIALAKKSKLLLLDEITSDLDGKAEGNIIDIIKDVSKYCTVIMIAHRINSIKNIDNIYVLKEGFILAKGTHEELTKKCGYYSSLVGKYK
ncbi:TPA: ABC transporter ATP-binding protein [Streptococcus pyogenes]